MYRVSSATFLVFPFRFSAQALPLFAHWEELNTPLGGLMESVIITKAI